MDRIAELAMHQRGFLTEPTAGARTETAAATDAVPSGLPDLRGLQWTSIDNPESRDLDQIEALETVAGGLLLRVAIADVDHYVPKDSALDQYAAQNAASVYTGIRVFPMLPERFSFDLTSLVADKPRAALVFETFIAPDGTSSKGRVTPALVENHAKLDYPSVSEWLDGKGPLPPPLAGRNELQEQVRQQDALAARLAEARRKVGSISLDVEELQPTFDASGEVNGLVVRQENRAGRIIAELMIASNQTATRCLDADGRPSLRRVLPPPQHWDHIQTYAATFGVVLPAEPNSAALAAFTDQMRRTHPADFAEISLAIVKMIGRALYAAHVPGSPEIGHFGLAITEYTHSTAPNRRYVDLVTQRLLKAMDAGTPSPYSLAALTEVAAHCTERSAEADRVERQVHKSLAARLLASRVGQVFAGTVTGASTKGTFVRVSDPAVEGKIVSGAGSLKVGDRTRVRLSNVDVAKGFIDFAVV
jgi:VacB/RNase II family 3'-5' exoribonuclease